MSYLPKSVYRPRIGRVFRDSAPSHRADAGGGFIELFFDDQTSFFHRNFSFHGGFSLDGRSR